MSHTSGIARDAPVSNAREPFGSFEEHILSVSDTWLRHKVGERYSYSNLGYDLVAYIVQVQSGQPFAKYVEDKVFTPLNMTHCSLDPEFIRNHSNRAVGHMSYVKQLPLVTDVFLGGSGSVYANAKGMAKFVQFFLNGGKVDGRAILDESLITGMFTPSQYFSPSADFMYGLGVEIYHNEYSWLAV